MAKRSTPEPFRYRGQWRAQVTLANGKRPCKDFDRKSDAADWIVEQLANNNTAIEPELEGPTTATLAEALHLYAHRYSITKGGCDAELNRINHYLSGMGMPWLRRVVASDGSKSMEEYTLAAQPSGWQSHNDARRAKRAKTYKLIHELGRTQCSQVTTAKLRDLMTTMSNERLTPSTIQKEIALLKHMFNMAATEWAWKGFENPCQGLKLGKSNVRFVHISSAQEEAIWKAVAQCDNPYFWPFLVASFELACRQDFLLNMTWEHTNLDGRVAQAVSKSKWTTLHLTKHLVEVLSHMPRKADDPLGKVFRLNGNKVRLIWDGVRKKAGIPKLQYKDIRHLAATELARRGWSANQLMVQLGHTTPRMASVYVNLAGVDMLELMDRTAKPIPVVQVPPPATASASEIQSQRRAERLVNAAKKRWAEASAQLDNDPQAAQPEGSEGELESDSDAAQKPAEVAQVESHQEATVTVEQASEAVQPPAPAAESVSAKPKSGEVIAVDFRRRAA